MGLGYRNQTPSPAFQRVQEPFQTRDLEPWRKNLVDNLKAVGTVYGWQLRMQPALAELAYQYQILLRQYHEETLVSKSLDKATDSSTMTLPKNDIELLTRLREECKDGGGRILDLGCDDYNIFWVDENGAKHARDGMRPVGDTFPVVAKLSTEHAPIQRAAQLIVAAVNYLPYLLGEIAELRQKVADLEAEKRPRWTSG